MFLEPPNAISVHSDHRRPTMDGEEQHHLREVPPNAASRHRIRDPHRVASRIHRGVFPYHVGALESSAIRDRSTTPDHPSEESFAIPSGALVSVVVGDWRRELFFVFFAFYRTLGYWVVGFCDDGEDSCVFTLKLHFGGNLVWKPKVEYKDGFVEYFDHFNCDEGSLLDLRRMVKQLRFADKKVQFWVKVKGMRNTKKIELRKVSTDADILVLNLEVPTNKELDIYVEHLYDDQWDYEVEISRSLGDDALMTDEGDEGSEQNSEREVDGPANEFQDIDVEVNGPTLDKVDEVDVEVDEVDCVHSEEIFRSLDDSDSERECNGGQNVFQERNLKKDGFKFVLGMIFKSASEFKWAVTYHEAMRRKDIKFVNNEGRRVRVCCRHSDVCKWTIFGSRSNPRCPFQIKTYNSEHTCGNQDENRTINLGFLAKLYKDEFRLNMEWGRRQFQEHGLLPAVEQQFPGVEHKFCIRHMHANFLKDGFTGNVLKQKLWGVCKATTEAEFKRQMEELKLENEKAAEWLAARDTKHYCRAFFSTFPKSDMLLNNLCESWNSTILSFRDKPLMTMCDKIRLYLMARMQKNRDKMKTYPHKICPKISKCLEEAKEKSARYSTYKSTDNLYQVDDHNFKAFKVDLAQRQCSCRVDSYLRSYEPAILPIQSSELWHKVDLPAPLPPKYKAQPGRPKKKRKIDPVQESKQQKGKLEQRK
nr:uncharacterized protein LOC109193258 [Ipomoea batatas]